jgi:hypothetical protein
MRNPFEFWVPGKWNRGGMGSRVSRNREPARIPGPEFIQEGAPESGIRN